MVFDDILKDNETLFKNPVALDYDFVPKLVPYRENEQKQIALAIKPLFYNRDARHLVVTGLPGIGKTVATKKVIEEIEEHTDEIYVFYINCWHKSTTYKIFLEICKILGYNYTHNKKSDELFDIIEQFVNKKSAVFVFDEIDKAEDYDFLYLILEKIYKKSIIALTNFSDWLDHLDSRLRSRFRANIILFKPYKIEEIKGILKERVNYAFYDNVVNQKVLDLISETTYNYKDVRVGLFLLKESANIAEDNAKKFIDLEHLKEAISKLNSFTSKNLDDFKDDELLILEILNKTKEIRIGQLYQEYQNTNRKCSYKTFQRKINKLEKKGMIITEKIYGGKDGSTTIIRTKDLRDYFD